MLCQPRKKGVSDFVELLRLHNNHTRYFMIVMAYLYAQAEQKTKAMNSHKGVVLVILYRNPSCSPRVWTVMNRRVFNSKK